MTDYERANIRAMQGYSWGEQPSDEQTIKLNTNENPYPPSPAVDKVLQGLKGNALRRYPDPTATGLRKLIAQTHDIQPDQIVITHAGDEALRLALTTFVDPGAGFGMAEPSYSLYPVLAAIQDARVHRVELDEHWLPDEQFATRINAADCALTCLVNPHAPSGTLLSTAQLRAIAAELNGLLLIDEAYIDFVDPAREHNAVQLINECDNVLILRTFSKGYSLAGLRLGYLMGPTGLIAPIMNKTRDSYNVDHISQQLGYAAFADQAHASKTWENVRMERSRLSAVLAQLGLHSPPSETNFLLVSVPAEHPLDASGLYTALKSRGILVRYFDSPRLRDKLRITVGTEVENNQLIEHLTDLLVED